MNTIGFLRSTLFIMAISFVGSTYAGFEFGDLTADGNGNFKQFIHEGIAIEVEGIIPKGVKDLKIYLNSSKDVDVQLFDKDNGKALVGWNIGAKIGSSAVSESVYYNGVTIKYSGYNGNCPSFSVSGNNPYSVCSSGKSPGNEYIILQGVTKNRLIMKAFGYQAGTADIKYSWKGVTTVKESGNGSFSSPVQEGKRIKLEGILPKGIENLSIALSANDDIDIELYNADNGDFVVGWRNKDLNNVTNIYDGKKAIIHSDKEITRVYKGDRITWSGWNGRWNHTNGTSQQNIPEYNGQKEKGMEYIRIYNNSKNKYIMKVYGYKNGSASVKYSWGGNIVFAGVLGQTKMTDSVDNTVNITKAKSGVLPNYFNKHWSGINGFNTNHYDTNVTGLPAITMSLSARIGAGGDMLLCDSGNSQYIYNYIQNLSASTNSRTKLYFSGHSSGGGDIQNLMWKFKNKTSYKIAQTFQIDSAELFSDDSSIPSNVKEAFNFYQNEDTASYATEGNIVAEDSNKTVIHNIKITNPTTGDSTADAQLTPHQRIDNDNRVWKRIVSEILSDSGNLYN